MAPGGAPLNHVAPDGGWGWMVVLGSFVMQALTIGVTYTFGVLYVVLLDVFKSSKADTAWIGSIQPALLYFTGIIASPLIKRFGWRAVAICGSILSAVGFVTSALVDTIYPLYFTYGVLTGIGNGLMYLTSMVAVQHYFDRRRAMATGLAVSGSGVGTLAFGFVTQKLLETVNWRWTLVIEGGFMLIGVFCGALFRPLPQQMEDEEAITLRGEENDTRPREDYKEIHGTNINENRGCCAACFYNCKGIMSEAFDLSLFKKPVYCLFTFGLLMFCFGYHVPYTYTPDRVLEQKIVNESEAGLASFLVSIMGISNVCSRLLFGWIGDKSETVRFWMAGICLTLGGVVSILIFLFTTYSLVVVYAVLFGAFTGCWASSFPCILVDLLGVENIERSLGLSLACASMGFLVASPMSGFIIESTGNNMDAPYFVVGSMETLGGLVYFTIYCVRKIRPGYEPIPDTERPRKRRSTRYISESFS